MSTRRLLLFAVALSLLAVVDSPAQETPDAVLLGVGEPSAVEAARLIEQLGHRDSAVRQAAIGRLLPYPDAARERIVALMQDGNLMSRLAALELLRGWTAPVDGLDPWQPDSLNDERQQALAEWLAQPVAAPTESTEPLTEQQLAAAGEAIDRMLRVEPAQAAAIRGRLARHGQRLLVEVYERLKKAETDEHRERLRALRYQLVADVTLPLRWPDGIERLSATDAGVRHHAAEQLATLAERRDQPLLLEIFADPDPLIREISLRALSSVGGSDATGALVRLLKDPEPNVRAAVLKRLAEDGATGMVPQVAAYLADEHDPDLVVHAIRYLRAAGGAQAVKALLPLLEHEQWQVRAETAQSLGEIISPYNDDVPTTLKADVYATLIEHLDDDDAFVVSRVVESLEDVDLALAVKPLVAAAGKHVQLAPQIVGIMVENDEIRDKAIPHLREFIKHEHAEVRAAAIGGLTQIDEDVREEIAAGLRDEAALVRITASDALFGILEGRQLEIGLQDDVESLDDLFGPSGDPFATQRLIQPPPSLMSQAVRGLADLFRPRAALPPPPDPAEGVDAASTEPLPADAVPAVDVPPTAVPPATVPADVPPDAAPPLVVPPTAGPLAAPATAEPIAESPDTAGADAEPSASDEDDPDQELRDFYADPQHPEWIPPLVEPLLTMLASDDPKERLAAALPLVVLGHGDKALPVIVAAPGEQPPLYERAVRAFPWLLWEDRIATFDRLLDSAPGDGVREIVVAALAQGSDPRSAERLWQLLADPELSFSMAETLHDGLLGAYLGVDYHSEVEEGDPRRDELAAAARQRVGEGNELQRLVSLLLLYGGDRQQAAEVARSISRDENVSLELRHDAVQVLLAALEGEHRTAEAVEIVAGDAPQAHRELAVAVLARGPGILNYVRGTTFYLGVGSTSVYYGFGSSNRPPVIPDPPEGLTAEQVRPLLTDEDAELAASAGYLLALFKQDDGLETLVAHWRSLDRKDEWDALVYRAIAALNSADHLPVLQEIYERVKDDDVETFYWTVRVMTGPEILEFRKQIRKEVGMDRLQ